MMDEFGVPWAPIFGNHEYDFHSDLYYLSKQMLKSENIILMSVRQILTVSAII